MLGKDTKLPDTDDQEPVGEVLDVGVQEVVRIELEKRPKEKREKEKYDNHRLQHLYAKAD